MVATTQYVRKPKYATARVVQQQIDHWAATEPAVLRCRSVWHSWKFYTGITNGKEESEILRCQECEGFKYRIINPRTGAVLKKWTPILDKDYYMPPGAGRINRQGMNYVRLAALATRTVVEAEGDIYDLVHAAMGGAESA
jgi:hypothetical protein